MNTAETLDRYCQLMPMTKDELDAQKIPADIRRRLNRLRTMYSHWIEYPNLSQKDMVEWIVRMANAQGEPVAKNTAWVDMALVSQIIGNLQASTKDFMRWKVTKMLEEDRQAARRAGDWKAVMAADANIAKIHQLDRQDTQEIDYSSIVPREYIFTSDLSVIGIKPRKDIRKLIKKLNKEMGRAEEAEYEEVTDE